jgi:hypothetical protein
LQLVPQIEPTSLTQIESQLVLQQNASEVQIFATHGSHELTSFDPVEQIG